MRYELKSISLWAFVKVSFFLHLIVGFVLGLLYALFFGVFMTILSRLPGMPSSDLETKSLPVGIMVVLFPIMFAILGAFFNTILGGIIVFIYNAVAKMVGGMELDLQPVAEAAHSAPQAPAISPSIFPQQSKPAVYTAPPPPPPPYRPSEPEPPASTSDPTPGGGI
jgi:hypothetical protein